VLNFLQRLSFVLWVGFTIFAVVLVGFGMDVIAYSAIIARYGGAQSSRVALVNEDLMRATTGNHPFLFPVGLIVLGVAAMLFSLLWWQIGITHFHYLEMDQLVGSEDEAHSASAVLKSLIREVEESSISNRPAARTKASKWLVSHVASLDEEDVVLARTHFGYLLPAHWNEKAETAGAKTREVPPDVF
jgi:hypothetical protein